MSRLDDGECLHSNNRGPCHRRATYLVGFSVKVERMVPVCELHLPAEIKDSVNNLSPYTDETVHVRFVPLEV